MSYARTMCLICIEFDKGRMTSGEARRALGEMGQRMDPRHRGEVEKKIEDAEVEGPAASPSTP